MSVKYRAIVRVNGEFYAMTSSDATAKTVNNILPYLIGYDAEKIELKIEKVVKNDYMEAAK